MKKKIKILYFPPTENKHKDDFNKSKAPAIFLKKLVKWCRQSIKIAEDLDLNGLLAVEFFTRKWKIIIQ